MKVGFGKRRDEWDKKRKKSHKTCCSIIAEFIETKALCRAASWYLGVKPNVPSKTAGVLMNIFHLNKINQCYLARCVVRGMKEHSKIKVRENVCWNRREGTKVLYMNNIRNQGKRRVGEKSQNGSEVQRFFKEMGGDPGAVFDTGRRRDYYKRSITPTGMDTSQMHLWDFSYCVSEGRFANFRNVSRGNDWRGLLRDVSEMSQVFSEKHLSCI